MIFCRVNRIIYCFDCCSIDNIFVVVYMDALVFEVNVIVNYQSAFFTKIIYLSLTARGLICGNCGTSEEIFLHRRCVIHRVDGVCQRHNALYGIPIWIVIIIISISWL